jgi:ABC-2 type transport system ATP-binding protein
MRETVSFSGQQSESPSSSARPWDLPARSDFVCSLSDIRVSYGSFEALRGICLNLPAGATGLVGRNGAGKSTLMRLMLGLVAPTSGDGNILGVDLSAGGATLRRAVGFMPENDAFLVGMRGLEQVALAGELCGLGHRQSIRRAHEVLTYVGLGEARYRYVEQYSTGMKQRLKLAVALAHDPQLLLLDEPTVGLDPPGRQRMLDLIDGLVRRFQKSLVISTHLLDDIQQTCEHVVMIERGQVLFAGGLSDLMKYENPQFCLRWDGPGQPFMKQLQSEGGKLLSDPRAASGAIGASGEDEARVAMPSGFDTRRFFDWAEQYGVCLRTVEPHHEDLSDLYLRLIQQKEST